MRSSLDHLPAGKRHELAFVVEVLREGFTAAMAKREPAEAALDHILKIILFGSYARGDWVEDPVGRYFSDYDLLVVVDEERLTELWEIWEGAEKRLLSALSSGARLRTPVNFIVHTLEDVNQQLEHGRSFFIDIVRDGVPLLELPDHPLVEPKALAPETALAEAQARLLEQMAAADEFMLASNFLRERNATKRAVFIAHQAVESLYTCLLLVMTLYTPKSHNLVRLRKLVEPLDFRLAQVWPTSTKSEKRCFEKLRAAYVKGRYSRHYEITAEELAWIAGRVAVLQALVRDICEARLEELRAQINPGPVGDADTDGQSSSRPELVQLERSCPSLVRTLTDHVEPPCGCRRIGMDLEPGVGQLRWLTDAVQSEVGEPLASEDSNPRPHSRLHVADLPATPYCLSLPEPG